MTREAIKDGIQLEQQSRLASEQELQLALRELRAAFEKQARARDQAEMKMSGTLTNYRESADKEAKTIEMALSRLSQDVSNTKQLLRDDQADRASAEDKIREELRNVAATERNVRAEADDTLRRDVIEALSKETRARQESDAKVVEDVAKRLSEYKEAAARDFVARDEALGQLEEAMIELREGIEAHTHELEVEGPSGGVNVRVQRVQLEGRGGRGGSPPGAAPPRGQSPPR